MSRVIQVAGRMIELSGLHGVWLGTKFPFGSQITLYYTNGSPTQTIDYEYGQWEQAEKDRNMIKALCPRDPVKSSERPTGDTAPGERLL